MKLIVGLGNPGGKYSANRHNIGFVLLDALGEAGGSASWRSKFQAEEMRLRLAGEDVILLKPQTFMNRSGTSVQAAAQFYKINPEEILVIHDELDLPPGKVKLKRGGGHAGHNGLRSIISHIGGDFARLRVGIGHPGDKNKVADYVLHDFAKADQEWIANLQDNIKPAIEFWLNGNDSRMISALTPKPETPPKPASGQNIPQKAVQESHINESAPSVSPFEALKALLKRGEPPRNE